MRSDRLKLLVEITNFLREVVITIIFSIMNVYLSTVLEYNAVSRIQPFAYTLPLL